MAKESLRMVIFKWFHPVWTPGERRKERAVNPTPSRLAK
jgi:hypothetical protein